MSLESPPELENLRRVFAAEGPAAAGPCPPADRIFAAAHGELAGEEGAAELGEILDHVAACPECTEAWRLAVEIGRELASGAATVDAGSRGRVIAGNFRRGSGEPGGLRRWSLPLGLIAAVLLVAIGLQLLPKAPPALRGDGEILIEDASGPLERERCVLRWRLVPKQPGALFEVRVMSEGLELLAQRTALTASELELPAERLENIPAGGLLLWQVRASLPDGGQVESATFRSRLP